MSKPDGSDAQAVDDRVSALEERLKGTLDDDRKDALRVLIALENLAKEVDGLSQRLRASEREIVQRGAVVDAYREWRTRVDQDISDLRVALAKLDERYATRQELNNTFVSRNQPGRQYEQRESTSPLTGRLLAGAALFLTLALVLALGGGDILRSLLSG